MGMLLALALLGGFVAMAVVYDRKDATPATS